jgi:hypothetical protein
MAQKQPALSLAQAHQHYLNYLALARAGREAEGLPSLQAAGEAAHPGALFSLAALDLQAPDRERQVGPALAKLSAASGQGHSAARQTLAVMHALGVGCEADWGAALALVMQSARSGDPGALRELGLLIEMAQPGHPCASEFLLHAARLDDVLAVFAIVKRAHDGRCDVPAAEIAFWTQALGRVKHPLAHRLPRVTEAVGTRPATAKPAIGEAVWSEVAELLAHEPSRGDAADGKQISRAPTIFEFKNFLFEEECDFLVGLSAPLLKQTTVYDPATGAVRPDPVRTSSEARYWLSAQNLTVHCLNKRMCRAAGVAAGCGEALSVLTYRRGEEYRPHFDFFAKNVEMIPDFQLSGQRTRTLLTYLNDDYVGGQTHFLSSELKYRGRTGDAILFHNVLEDGEGDRSTKHAGLPVEQGVKWLGSKWFRAREYWS